MHIFTKDMVIFMNCVKSVNCEYAVYCETLTAGISVFLEIVAIHILQLSSLPVAD